MAFFQEKTLGNVVVMGRNTWISIPQSNRPLKNRINLILTRDKQLLSNKTNKNFKLGAHYYVTFKQVLSLIALKRYDIYFIGGAQVYNQVLDSLDLDRLFITEMESTINIAFDQNSFTYINKIPEKYKIKHVSEPSMEGNTRFRFIEYVLNNKQSSEHVYLNLMKKVLETGNVRQDRTNVGTISRFGEQVRFDISESIPVVTTKKIPWKHCIEELLWFLRGDTDAKILERKGVKIWSGNTSREFLDSQNLHHYETGILGAGYGWQWRHFGARYTQTLSDTSKVSPKLIGGFDQIQYILDELTNNPDSRRIVLSSWNPCDFKVTALQPCHYSVQFYTELVDGIRHLSCHYIMRSNDLFLGAPWNIMSYAVLTYILAMKTGMVPKELVFTGSDVHVYNNHVQQVKEQLQRAPRAQPVLIIKDLKNTDFADMTVEDFDLVGYFPDEPIRAPMAV
jgi:thymidylate synthase